MSWLVHFLGLDFGAPHGHFVPYDLWSGSGSDAGEVTILAAAIAAYRKHQCHQGRCWRIGRHQVDGTPWCNRHHGAARRRTGTPPEERRG